MPWIAPSGWSQFQTNYTALKSLSVPSQYQPMLKHLLASGSDMLTMQKAGTTVYDSDVTEWLYLAKQLADRLHQSGMSQSAQAGMDQSSGILSDAYRYYTGDQNASLPFDWNIDDFTQSLPSPQSIQQHFSETENIVLWLVAGVAAIVVLPPLIRAIAGK